MAKEILTKENFERLYEAIEKYKGTKGPLMPTLHEGQKIFGALPFSILTWWSFAKTLPIEKISAITSNAFIFFILVYLNELNFYTGEDNSFMIFVWIIAPFQLCLENVKVVPLTALVMLPWSLVR